MDKTCNLRLLEPSDLEFLERIENDTRLWKYSNTTKPFSNEVLKIYIQNAKQDIVDAGQQRFVIVDSDSNKLGLIDLFDYEPKHARAAVGVVIIEEYRGKGYAKEGLRLLEEKERPEKRTKRQELDVSNCERIVKEVQRTISTQSQSSARSQARLLVLL